MKTKLETMLNKLIENLSTAHVNHAELEQIKQEILQEALKPTVCRLDYYDGEYYRHLVHSYDRGELEKLIADATEYHKTIKDLDFDDDEAVDAWLEKHPLNNINGDKFNDLLDIDDYEPLSEYLSIYSFEVSEVQEKIYQQEMDKIKFCGCGCILSDGLTQCSDCETQNDM